MTYKKLIIRMSRTDRIFAIIYIIIALYIQILGISLFDIDLYGALLFYCISVIVGLILVILGLISSTSRLIITNEKISVKILYKTSQEVNWTNLKRLNIKFSPSRKSSYNLVFKYTEKSGLEDEIIFNLGSMIFFEKRLRKISKKLVNYIEEITDKPVEIKQVSIGEKVLFDIYSTWRWNLE